MKPQVRVVLILANLATVVPGWARLEPQSCATHPDKVKEDLFLHRQAIRKFGSRLAAGRTGSPQLTDRGDIAVLDGANGIVGRRNPFDLNQETLAFLPDTALADSYHASLAEGGYDAGAAEAGARLPLADDDAQRVVLPFDFPFFGAIYREIYINSDGNATFTAGDAGSTDRSFGRFTGGLPRIAPLFSDLDPSAAGTVYLTSMPDRFVVSWVSVPPYVSSGIARPETFQMRLYPDGRIEFAWLDAAPSEAVVGIAPGRLRGGSALVSFTAGAAGSFAGAVGERFSETDSIDIVSAARQFYAAHEDAYDYLVIFNSGAIPAAPGAVAYEVTVRNRQSGFGDGEIDIGQDFGSGSRLQAVLNMGPLGQYPADPDGIVPARFLSRDTPLTVLGHEAGHLFLAYASVTNPGNPGDRPMLGRQLSHWSFLFNSEASFLEGNRIEDRGPDVSPQFLTTATVQGYSPLDQYLMGFRAPEEVPALFLVADSPEVASGNRSPQSGIAFNGARRDIAIEELIQAVGRRRPDHTVAQRRYRFAFLLVTPAGITPSDAQMAQLEAYRSLFGGFFERAASGRASAETSLRRALQFSAFPAAGVVNAGMIAATLSLDRPAGAPVTVLLDSETGAVALPPAAVVPAGATTTTFFLMGLRPGVDTVTAAATDGSYEVAAAKIQVAESPASLQLQLVSGGVSAADPVVVRVTDINGLPYPNVVVRGTAVAETRTEQIRSASDARGQVRVELASDVQGLFLEVPDGPSLALVFNTSPAAALPGLR